MQLLRVGSLQVGLLRGEKKVVARLVGDFMGESEQGLVMVMVGLQEQLLVV